MNQPRPPEPDDTPNTSCAAINVREAKAQPIFIPVSIDGNAAGIRIVIIYGSLLNPSWRPTMRIVGDTDKNTGLCIERHRPKHRVHDHKHQAGITEAEPQ